MTRTGLVAMALAMVVLTVVPLAMVAPVVVTMLDLSEQR